MRLTRPRVLLFSSGPPFIRIIPLESRFQEKRESFGTHVSRRFMKANTTANDNNNNNNNKVSLPKKRKKKRKEKVTKNQPSHPLG